MLVDVFDSLSKLTAIGGSSVVTLERAPWTFRQQMLTENSSAPTSLLLSDSFCFSALLMTDFIRSWVPYSKLQHVVDVAYNEDTIPPCRRLHLADSKLNDAKNRIMHCIPEVRWERIPSWLKEHILRDLERCGREMRLGEGTELQYPDIGLVAWFERQVFAINQQTKFAPFEGHPNESPRPPRRLLPLAEPALFAYYQRDALNEAFPLIPLSQQYSSRALCGGCRALAWLLEKQDQRDNRDSAAQLRKLGRDCQEKWWEVQKSGRERRRISRNLYNTFVWVLYSGERINVDHILRGTYSPPANFTGACRAFPFENYPNKPAAPRLYPLQPRPIGDLHCALRDIDIAFSCRHLPELQVRLWRELFARRLPDREAWYSLSPEDQLQLLRELQAFALQLPKYETGQAPGPGRIFESIAKFPLDGMWRDLEQTFRQLRQPPQYVAPHDLELHRQPSPASFATIHAPPPVHQSLSQLHPHPSTSPAPSSRTLGQPEAFPELFSNESEDYGSWHSSSPPSDPHEPLDNEYTPLDWNELCPPEVYGSPRPTSSHSSQHKPEHDLRSLARQHCRIGWRTARSMGTTPQAWAEERSL